MSFIDQWRSQLDDSLAACAKLAAAQEADLKYEFLIVGIFWPIRQAVQDFDLAAMQAVREVAGEQAKHILRMLQQWEDEPLVVAQTLSTQGVRSGDLGKSLNLFVAHFKAFPIFARQLAGQVKTASKLDSEEVNDFPDEVPPPPRVFLFYMQADGQTLAGEIRRRLEAENITLWPDIPHLEDDRDWWRQVTQALSRVDFMVLAMTPAAVRAPAVRKLWRFAHQQGVCIYPVFQGEMLEFTALPNWIREVHFYNLTIEWRKLITDLKGDCQIPRVPFMAEELPTDFVERPAEFEQIVSHIFDSEREEGLATTVGLVGAAGYGKTTLATAICHEDYIVQAFNNGILWVTLGENPGDLNRYLIDLIEVLSGERPGFTGLDAAMVRLAEFLEGRDLVLVIDDVWQAAHLKPFLQGGLRCARLITTRNADILPLDAEIVKIGPMQNKESVTLLSQGLSTDNQKEMRQLARRLGEWPLLLDLINGVLRSRVQKQKESLAEALTQINDLLDKQGLTAFDMDSTGGQARAVGQTLEISLGQLDETERTRLSELVIFPEDINLPLAAIEKLWAATAGLDDFDTEELCHYFFEISLLSQFDLTSRHVRMHKSMHSYLAFQQASELPGWHTEFLNAHSRPWRDAPLEDGYLWTYLIYHLSKAGRHDELIETVTDLGYLIRKIRARGVYYAERDLLEAENVVSNYELSERLALLRRALSQAGHLLVRCKTESQIANTFHSRLVHAPQLAPLLARAEAKLPKPLLTARHALPDLPDSALIRTLRGHTTGILDCAVTADGRVVVSVSKDNTLIVWRTDTGDEWLRLTGVEAEIWSCAIGADGRVLAYAQNNGKLVLYDVSQKKELLTWLGHEAGIVSCALNGDASLLVTASKDQTLKLWDTRTGQERLKFTGHQRSVTGCDICADGSTVASASNDGMLNVWDARTGQVRFTTQIQFLTPGVDHLTFMSQRDISFTCALSADGTAVAATSSGGTLAVWDVETGAERFSLSGNKRGIQDCALDEDGSVVACALSSGDLKVWDAINGMDLLTLTDHSRTVNSCALSASGDLIVSASDDRTLKVWNGQTASAQEGQQSRQNPSYSCAIDQDGTVAVSAVANKTLKLWDVASGSEKWTLKGHTRKINECRLSLDGTTLVSASQDQHLIVWDAQTGRQRLTLTGHTWSVNGCAISADGSMIVSASEDKTLKVWDAHTGQERLTLTGHTRAVSACLISPDKRRIISASGDGTLKIWDAQSGEALATLRGHTAWVNSCALSADGQTLVSASYDQTLKVWNAHDGSERFTLRGHELTVTGCALSADGRTIISVSRDKTVRVWSARNGRCVAALFVDQPLFGCACSADAGTVVAAGTAGTYFLRLDQYSVNYVV